MTDQPTFADLDYNSQETAYYTTVKCSCERMERADARGSSLRNCYVRTIQRQGVVGTRTNCR